VADECGSTGFPVIFDRCEKIAWMESLVPGVILIVAGSAEGFTSPAETEARVHISAVTHAKREIHFFIAVTSFWVPDAGFSGFQPQFLIRHPLRRNSMQLSILYPFQAFAVQKIRIRN
jgi:hypothetical protein